MQSNTTRFKHLSASAIAAALLLAIGAHARADILNFTHATNTNWDDAATDLNFDDTTAATTGVAYSDGSDVTFDTSHGSSSSQQAVAVGVTATTATGVAPASVTFINSGGTAGNYTFTNTAAATSGITGATGLTLATGFTGNIILSSTNTYTGTTTINGGTLRADSGPLPATTPVVLGGGTFTNSTGSSGKTYGNTFTITAGTSNTIIPNNNTTFNGNISSTSGGTAANTLLTIGGNKTNTTSSLAGFTGTFAITGTTIIRLNAGSASSAAGSATAIFDTGATGTLEAFNGGGSGSGALTNAIPLGALQGTGGTLAGATHSGATFYAIGGLGLSTTFAGTINNTNTVGLFIVGGALNLTGASNIYAGGTTVQTGGALFANNAAGSATGTGAVTINSSAIFGGNGAITGATTVNAGTLPTSFATGGHIAPGSAGASAGSTAGTLTLGGGLTLNDFSNLDFILNGDSTSTGNDLVSTTNLNLSANGLVQVNFTFNDAPANGATYDLINYTGTLAGSPTTWTATGLPAGITAAFTAPANGQIDVTFSSAAAAPEPASLSVLCLGAAALLTRRRSGN